MSTEHEQNYHHATGFEMLEHPTENVEDVTVALDEAFQNCRVNPSDGTCDCSMLHSRICHTEIGLLFESYENHQILTVADIKKSIDLVLESLSLEITEVNDGSEESVFVTEKAALLKNRGDEIDRATRRYVQTVSKFFHIKKQQFRLDVEDFKAKFQEIDTLRRIAHNGLIETLTIYTKTIHELQEYGLLADLEITQWHSRDRFQDDSDTEGKVFIFAPEVLKNRDLVKDWAISAHMYNRLHEIEEMQKGAQTT
jgi:uncharacterized ubiquitin-like protein YukD